MTDYVVAHPVYRTILLYSTQPECARSSSISYGNFFKNPRRNWSKKLENVESREGEGGEGEKKKWNPRISGTDSIHGIKNNCGNAPMYFPTTFTFVVRKLDHEPESDMKIERER